jgi:hypothetical protein
MTLHPLRWARPCNLVNILFRLSISRSLSHQKLTEPEPAHPLATKVFRRRGIFRADPETASCALAPNRSIFVRLGEPLNANRALHLFLIAKTFRYAILRTNIGAVDVQDVFRIACRSGFAYV